MIRIQLEYLVVINLLAMLLFIAALWALYEWRRRRGERKSRESLVCCVTCNYVFRARSRDSLARCPRCSSWNERSGYDHL